MNLEKQLVTHLTFDSRDTSGTTLRDRSGRGGHASLSGGVTTGVSAPVGEGYSFDTTDDAVRASSAIPSSWGGAQAMTVSFWAKLTTDASRQWIVDLGKDGTKSDAAIHFLQNDNDTANFGWWSSGYQWKGDLSPYIGEWTHFIGQYDPVADEFRVYINGNHVASKTGTDTLSFDGTKLSCGENSNGSAGYYAGDISALRVYGRVLSESEINALYQIRTPRNNSPQFQKGLVGHYAHGSVNSSTTLYDNSGYGNDAATGSALSTESGKFGTAITLDGNTAQTSSAQIKDAIESAHFTFSAWWRQDTQQDTDDWQDVIQWKDGTGIIKRIERANANASSNADYWCNLGANPNFTNGHLSNNDTGISNQTWFHFVVVVDATNNEFSIYLNGSLDRQSGVDASSIARPTSDIKMNVHAAGGALEDIRFYNYAMSATEVQQLNQRRTLGGLNV